MDMKLNKVQSYDIHAIMEH